MNVIYGYDQDRVFAGVVDADQVDTVSGVTSKKPPETGQDELAVFVGGGWVLRGRDAHQALLQGAQLTKRRAELRRELSARKQAAFDVGVDVGGHVYHADLLSACTMGVRTLLIDKMVQIAPEGVAVPTDTRWKAKTGHPTLSQDQILTVVLAVMGRIQEIYDAEERLADQIHAAKSHEDLAAVITEMETAFDTAA
jgi:hypothetical protein